MIGNYVTVYRIDSPCLEWVELRKIDAAGVYVYRRKGLDNGMLFIPMSQVKEIVDTGRRAQ